MNIVDLDEDREWFMWIIEEVCGMDYDDYLLDKFTFTREMLELYLDKIIKGIRLYSNADLGYQMLAILILQTGATLPDIVKREVLKSTTWEYDKKWKLRSGGENLRKFYLNDFREKILTYTSGTPTFLLDLKISLDSDFEVTSIGLNQFHDNLKSGKITSFNYINLDFCELSVIPAELFDFDHIEYLSMEYNHLVEIPEKIKSLVNLKYLWLDFNQIRALPKSICELKSLKGLSISYNNIEVWQDFLNMNDVNVYNSHNPFEKRL